MTKKKDNTPDNTPPTGEDFYRLTRGLFDVFMIRRMSSGNSQLMENAPEQHEYVNFIPGLRHQQTYTNLCKRVKAVPRTWIELSMQGKEFDAALIACFLWQVWPRVLFGKRDDRVEARGVEYLIRVVNADGQVAILGRSFPLPEEQPELSVGELLMMGCEFVSDLGRHLGNASLRDALTFRDSAVPSTPTSAVETKSDDELELEMQEMLEQANEIRDIAEEKAMEAEEETNGA